MNRYKKTFDTMKSQNRIAFIPFASAGDPDCTLSEAILQAYIDAGADILEIGYPFSDPMADGPVNQRAAQRAIAAGMNHARFFAMIARLRKKTDIPFGILLYANSIHHLGCEQFCARAAKAGIDSILAADMPPEESRELLLAQSKHGIGSVFIVSELTDEKRIRSICSHADGFIYVVSRLGTTGVQSDFSASTASTIHRLRQLTDLPLCVGFGISTPEHVAAVKNAGADGAIVGSALVKTIEQNAAKPEKMLRVIKAKVRAYVKATR